MGNFGFWAGIGAAQKTAAKSTKSIDRRHHVISIGIGILGALLIAAVLLVIMLVNHH